MTDYPSDEVRAVVLSALMVLSVFGGTVAFSEPAAAQSFDSGSITPSTVEEQTSNEHAVTVTVSDVNTNDTEPQTLTLDSVPHLRGDGRRDAPLYPRLRGFDPSLERTPGAQFEDVRQIGDQLFLLATFPGTLSCP
jgi:surface glycoprotein (TIGR04207 family)